MAEERFWRSAWVVGAIIALLAILTLLPAFWFDGLLGDDAGTHSLWQAHFAPVWWQGTLYPRWLPDMNRGFGSPAFFIYPPLTQWLAALWWPVLPRPLDAMTRLVLATAMLSVIGAMGCWWWLRELVRLPAAALAGALIQLLYPYRLYVDVYQRCALGEVAGLAIMPWLLLFVDRGARGDRRAWCGLSLATGALFFAHLPSALIGVGFAACYAMLRIWQRRSRGLAIRAAGAIALGVAIGAASAIPALSLFRFLSDPSNLIGDRQQPDRWLIFSPTPWPSFAAWVAVIAMVVLAMVLTVALIVMILRARGGEDRGLLIFLVGAMVAVVVLNLKPSRFFWAMQTPLSRIQFPFRLIGLHVLIVAALGAVAVQQIWTAGSARTFDRLALLLLVPALLAVDAGLLASHAYARRDKPWVPMAVTLAKSTETGEYVLGPLPLLAAMFGERGAIVVGGAASLSDPRLSSRHAELTVAARRPATVALRQFAFSGWECQVDQGGWAAAPAFSALRAVPTCAVPAGRHTVAFRMPATPGERAGYLATAGGLLVVLIWFGFASRRRATAADGL